MHPDAPAGSQKIPLLPPGTVPNAALLPDQRLSWLVEMLPFVDEDALYRRIDRTTRWDGDTNIPAVQTPLQWLRCPDWVRQFSPEPAYTTPYVGMAGLGVDAPSRTAVDNTTGVFAYDRRTRLTGIPDGTSNTLMILETARENGPWSRGGPATVRGLDREDKPYLGTGKPFGGTHFAENGIFTRGASIGCNAAMVDGSVRCLSEAIAPEVLAALATIAGGEQIGENW